VHPRRAEAGGDGAPNDEPAGHPEGRCGSRDASRPGRHRRHRAGNPACNSGVGTCKGRPFGAAFGGACRPDLDRTRPLRWGAPVSGRLEPAGDRPTPIINCRSSTKRRSENSDRPTIGDSNASLATRAAGHRPTHRRAASSLLRRARGVHDHEVPFSPLIDAKEAGRLLGVPPTWLLAQARARRIPHHRLGHYVRFSAGDLRRWLGETRIGDTQSHGRRQ
jgi:hypothetical protein